MQPSPEVRDAFVRYIQALAAGDATAIDGLISREAGVFAIGTDPIEWWSGHDAIVGGLRAIFTDVGGGLPLRPNAPQAYSEAVAGWAFDQPVITPPAGEPPTFRLSAVFRREPDAWRIVLIHGSIAVPVGSAAGGG